VRFLLVGLAIAACSDSRAPEERAPQRRVIEPPSGDVRALPPYVITTEGVGPYKLRQPIAPLLDKLKSGPLSVRFEIPNILHSALSRAEDGMLLVGSEVAAGTSSAMTFIAVIGDKVARTESKLGVGSTKDEAVALGVVTDEIDRARDPRLLVPAAVKNARLVIDRNKRVAAVVVTSDPITPVTVGPRERDECPRPAATAPAFGTCLTGSGEVVEIDGDDLIVKFPEGDNKPIARLPVPNLVFAAPLRNPNDGRDELIVITRNEEANQRSWMMVAFRHDNGQLKRSVEPWPHPLYQLTSSQTRWIGAELSEVDLYLELASRPEGIEVGGLLTTTRGNRIHDALTISPVMVSRKHHKPATNEALDAGAPGEPPSSPPDRAAGSATR
jgi:hypothetical protein